MPRIYVEECIRCGSSLIDPEHDDIEHKICGKCLDRENEDIEIYGEPQHDPEEWDENCEEE